MRAADQAEPTLTVKLPPVVHPYTPARWAALVERTFHTVVHVSKAKGGEYSGDEDRLLNFRRNADALGLEMEQIWAVYAAKHWDAIMQYVKDITQDTRRIRTEPIDGRVTDLIVYLILFRAMLEENGDQP